MHTPEIVQTVELGADPYMLIKAPQLPDQNFDIKMKAAGWDNADEMVAILLMLVEQMTGVSSNSYLREIDLMRSASWR